MSARVFLVAFFLAAAGSQASADCPGFFLAHRYPGPAISLAVGDLNADGTKHTTIEYCAALRLLDTITGEASLEYVEVTRQCIECHFNQGAASLDNDVFREAVYDNVVMVLEEEASRFARP